MHLIFLIVNKHGSLVFSRVMNTGMSNSKQYDANELITLASTFHSIHAISSQITPTSELPVESVNLLASPVLEGITDIVADQFVFKSLQTLTGVKFLLAS